MQKDTELDTRGQARHEDHFLLEGGPVRVLCERRLKDLVFTLSELIGFPFELHVEKPKEKEVTDLEKMKTTIEEEGKEGDDPKIEEFDVEKENQETKKKMKEVKEVFHKVEHLNMYKLLNVIDVPVVQVVIWTRSLTCPLCATTGVSRAVKVPQIQFHRRNWWTFQFATETGMHSANCAAGSLVRRVAVEAAMLGWAFFALLQVVPELSASFRSPR